MSIDPLLLVLFLVLFVPATWIFATFFVSRTCGWSRLVRLHPAPEPAWTPYEFLTWRSISLGYFSNYNHCMNISIAPEGLILRPCWLFILFHPPLFLPWKSLRNPTLKDGWLKGLYCQLPWGRLVIRGVTGTRVHEEMLRWSMAENTSGKALS
jgi:hypothetical protein